VQWPFDVVSRSDQEAQNSASVQQVIHFGQITNRNSFQQFDYTKRKANMNQELYSQDTPPMIDVSQITDTPIALFVGQQDRLSTVQDAHWLNKTLGTVVEYEEL
jgi:hypothetical protein